MGDFDKLIELFSKLPEERQKLLLEQLERENGTNGADTRGNYNREADDSGKIITGCFPKKDSSET